jgi:hypothetical protein
MKRVLLVVLMLAGFVVAGCETERERTIVYPRGGYYGREYPRGRYYGRDYPRGRYDGRDYRRGYRGREYRLSDESIQSAPAPTGTDSQK